jgi:photosystem II stability/assembly factor-like uncharacterized protein
VGPSRGYLSYTSDEDSWEEIDLSNMYTASGGFSPVSMTYGNGLFVVVGSSGTFNYTKDGKFWTHLENIDEQNKSKSHFKNIEFMNGKFYATGNWNRVVTIVIDGDKLKVENVAKNTDDIGDNLTTIAYNGNTYLATRYNQYKSKDGVNWKQFRPTIKNSSSLQYIVSAPDGMFVAAKEMGGIAYSTDNGSSWTMAEGITSDDIKAPHLTDIILTNNKYVAVGMSSNVWVSENGKKWNEVKNDDIYNSRIYSMAYAELGR